MRFQKSVILPVLFGLICLTALPSYSACTGGDEAVGKNGKVYCVSKIGMNWWSAFAWCEAQGMKLGDLTDLCYVSDEEKWMGATSNGACPNIVNAYSGNVFTWTAVSLNTGSARVINPRSGSLNSFGKADASKYTICAPK